MIKIAVTGGMGAGKSAVADILAEVGAKVICADAIGHMVYSKGTSAYQDVVEAFGNEILRQDGEIDRRALGTVVFADLARLQELEHIVWPRIRERLVSAIDQHRRSGNLACAIDAAVLYEAGWDDLADQVWVVDSSYHQRLARVMRNTGLSANEVRQRMDAQLDPETKKSKADVVIHNDCDLNSLRDQVIRLWDQTTANLN